MSTHIDKYQLRYSTPRFQQQIETAVMHAAQQILGIAKAGPPPATNPDAVRWAKWANTNSSIAWLPFAWPCCLDPAICASYESDPSGQSISDDDVQRVVDATVDDVVADWATNNPVAI